MRERESNFSATFLSCLAFRSRSRRNARRILLILKLYGLLGSAVQSFLTLVSSLIAKRSECRDVCLFVAHLASAGIAILRAERTGVRELQMVWIRRTV
jgi:hypothetical protein